MAAQTFQDVWFPGRLRFPSVPALLVRDWAQDSFTRLCEYRGGGWSFLRKEASLDIAAARTVTVTFTQASTTVTSAAGFVASDVGRQIRGGNQATALNTYPIYTITALTDPSTITIDQPYADPGGPGISATILDAYTVCPADFRRFIVIADKYFQRILPFWISQDELALTDPARRISDTGPRYLIAQGYSTAPLTLGQTRYEYSPYPTAERHYPYLYYKQASRLVDTDSLPGVLANRADLLKVGLEVEAAEWPGTTDQKNPYYNLALAERKRQRWETLVQQASLDDDNQYPEDYMAVHWARRYFPLAHTTQWLRQTDATLADYIGG